MIEVFNSLWFEAYGKSSVKSNDIFLSACAVSCKKGKFEETVLSVSWNVINQFIFVISKSMHARRSVFLPRIKKGIL